LLHLADGHGFAHPKQIEPRATSAGLEILVYKVARPTRRFGARTVTVSRKAR
jgi:hypothetical protein